MFRVRWTVRPEAADGPLGHRINQYTVIGAMVNPVAWHQQMVRKDMPTVRPVDAEGSHGVG